MNDPRTRMVKELLQYFLDQHYTIIGVVGVDPYALPPFLANDGFGDQRTKRPDILAFDTVHRCQVLGIVKTAADNLESVQALTEYDVFFDHKSKESEQPSRVCFILPESCIAEFTTIITHYIHRDYWQRLMIVRSKEAD